MTSHRADRSARTNPNARRFGGWLLYAVVSLVLAALTTVAVIVLVANGDSDPESPQGQATDGSSSVGSTRSEPPPDMTLPESTGKWTVFSTPEARAEIEQVLKGLDDAVAGFFVHDSAPNTPVFFVGINAPLGDGAPAKSIEGLLEDASVAEPETYDAGPAGGALACGDAADRGKEWVTCAWVTDHSAALMRWPDRRVSADEAAELTLDFRALTGG